MFLVIDLIFSVTEQISGEHTERQGSVRLDPFEYIVKMGEGTDFLNVTMYSNGSNLMLPLPLTLTLGVGTPLDIFGILSNH